MNSASLPLTLACTMGRRPFIVTGRSGNFWSWQTASALPESARPSRTKPVSQLRSMRALLEHSGGGAASEYAALQRGLSARRATAQVDTAVLPDGKNADAD